MAPTESSAQTDASAAIEDYAVIGDGHTAALVSLTGSIDWLCLPRFDSASCFSRLLGDPDGSCWQITPAADDAVARRRYLEDTNVLETTVTTSTGEIRVIDFMPTGDGRVDVVRRIEGVRGTVRLRHQLVIRFDYGRIRPWVRREQVHGTEVIVAVAGPDKLVLAGPRLPRAADGRHEGELDVAEGDCLDFTLTWVPSHRETPGPVDIDIDERLQHTLDEQRTWAVESAYEGPFAETVVRSLLTLHGLTHEETGGIVAAATTSLPESFGGERNWDYRYSWLRDASLTVETIVGTKRAERAAPWRNWLLRAVAGDPEDLQIVYTIDGGRHLPERTIPELRGYADSRPVRVGNAAVGQRQNDVIGEVLWALAAAREAGLAETRGQLEPPARAGREPRQHLAATRPRAVGDPWAGASLHAQPGHGLGRVRPDGARSRAARTRRPRRPLARPARPGARGRAGQRRSIPGVAASPSTTRPPRSTPHSCCCPSSASSRATIPGWWRRSRPSRRT